jgi:hypothetical protein
MKNFLISLPKKGKKYKEIILKSEDACLILREDVKVFLYNSVKCEKCGKIAFIISHPFNFDKPYTKTLFLFCPYCFYKKKISYNYLLKIFGRKNERS